MKTSELTGAALDYAVAIAEGGNDFGFDGITHAFKLNGRLKVLATGWALTMSYHPSTDWAQGGPIIERERVDINATLNQGSDFDEWRAVKGVGAAMRTRYGPTPLIAAMRCYVASKLGDEVEIPEELLTTGE